MYFLLLILYLLCITPRIPGIQLIRRQIVVSKKWKQLLIKVDNPESFTSDIIISAFGFLCISIKYLLLYPLSLIMDIKYMFINPLEALSSILTCPLILIYSLLELLCVMVILLGFIFSLDY